MKPHPRICCIPVSWPDGLGELARVSTLSTALAQRLPSARFEIVLNRHLPPAALAMVPQTFGVTLLDTSPTNDDLGVAGALDRCSPHLVLFDNAGTAWQCRHARELGARTVFLSTRERTLARGLDPDWLPWLDEHWIVGPRALARPLSRERRLQIARSGTCVRWMQALFTPSQGKRMTILRRGLGGGDARYLCFVPGGGGGTVDGVSAVTMFAQAAGLVARQARVPCVLLVGPLFQGELPTVEGVIVRRAQHGEVVDLMQGAQLVVLGASSTLFQALAQKKVCVATSTGGKEQLQRARAWARRGVIEAAQPNAVSLAAAVCALLGDSERMHALATRVEGLKVENDLARAVDCLEALLS